MGRHTSKDAVPGDGLTAQERQSHHDFSAFYKHLDLYVKVIHVHNFPKTPSNYKGVDFVVVRGGLEGEYSGIEHEVYPGVFESIKCITYNESLRVAEYAFEHAFCTGRNKVTCVHKANIMKLADGLFLKACREAAKRYPSIEYEEMIVDNTSMQLIKNPEAMDVMVMPNLYGSIITGIGAGLVGGPGILAGANFGPEYSLFEPGTRSSGWKIAGKGVANPTGLLFASVNMLRALGLPRFGDLISEGIYNVYREGKVRPIDVGGVAGTKEFTNRVIEEVVRLDKHVR